VETISTAALSLRDAFERDGVSPVEIDMGSCADFADALSQDLAEQGISVEITGTDYFWPEDGGSDEMSLARREGIVLPPTLTWQRLADLDFANSASHTWIEYDGFCYDAEMTEGTRNPFDFPCIRHALTEIMEIKPGRLEKLVAEHDWWRQSMGIRTERELSLSAVMTPGI
jgi:hypothetical protein